METGWSVVLQMAGVRNMNLVLFFDEPDFVID
jgi:hypothetical protein